MYICNGELKGRKILTPADQRLVESKVREVLYNKLGDKVSGKRVLDLYAGSGAVGIEMLSWGAESCTFCDKSKKSFEIIKKNIEICDISAKSKLYLKDSVKLIYYLKQEQQHFDVVFIDPPYNIGLVTKSLQALSTYDIVCDIGFIVVTAAKTEQIELSGLDGYDVVFDRVYGYPRVLVLQKVLKSV